MGHLVDGGMAMHHQNAMVALVLEEALADPGQVVLDLMAKIKVNGKEADPLYVFLKERAPGDVTSAVKWNFTKFLVSRDGLKITRHASADTPEALEKPIEALLGE